MVGEDCIDVNCGRGEGLARLEDLLGNGEIMLRSVNTNRPGVVQRKKKFALVSLAFV